MVLELLYFFKRGISFVSLFTVPIDNIWRGYSKSFYLFELGLLINRLLLF